VQRRGNLLSRVRTPRGPNHIKRVGELGIGMVVRLHEFLSNKRRMSASLVVIQAIDLKGKTISFEPIGPRLADNPFKQRTFFKLGLESAYGNWHKFNWLERVED